MCSNLKSAGKTNVLLLTHRNEFTMLLGDDTLSVFWFDCLLITCSCQSGKRAKDWNDFPAPLSRIPLNVSRSLAASFDLWPGTRPASGRVANVATADGLVARTACPPFETAENSKSELIWLHRDTDYSQGDYTGLWDASRPMCVCLCLCVCVSACVLPCERACSALPTETAAQDTHLPAWTQKRIIVHDSDQV